MYLDAIATLPAVSVYEGQFKAETTTCHRCGHEWEKPEEKGTDVNIAIQLVSDAVNKSVDTLILVSGDSDLVPAIELIHRLTPRPRIVAAFPPSRRGSRVAQAGDASFTIGRASLSGSQFPDEVVTPSGHVLSRPMEWPHPSESKPNRG